MDKGVFYQCLHVGWLRIDAMVSLHPMFVWSQV